MLRRRFAPAFGLLLLTFVVYAPAVNGGFLWDDDTYITANKTLTSTSGLGRIWFEPGATPQYYPLVFSSFWVEYHIWELDARGYLAVNIVMHGMNAVLLWLVLQRLAVPGAWLAAALFAVHPVYVESISWIQERKNLLSGLFFFASMLAYLRFAGIEGGAMLTRRPAGHLPGRRTAWYVLALLLGAAAFLSKTAACALPAALGLLLWWKRTRLTGRDLLALGPLFAISIAAGLMTVWVEWKVLGVGGADWSLTPLERSLIAGRALWFYAWKLAWPTNLAFIYPRWHIDASVWWQYLFPVGAVAIIGVLWVLRRRIGAGPLVAVLFYAGMLLPTLGFVNFYFMRLSFVADHLVYIPSVSLLALAAALGVTAMRALRLRPPIVIGAAAAILVALGSLTRQQEEHFQNTIALYTDTLAKNPECWLAHNNLANAQARNQEYGKAIDHLETALRIKPDYAAAHYNLAKIFARHKDYGQARAHFLEVLQISPESKDVRFFLGFVCLQLKQYDDAAGYFTAQLLRNSDDAPLALTWFHLGQARVGQKHWSEACASFEHACEIEPDKPGFHRALADALRQLGKTSEAEQQETEARRLGGT